MLSKTIPLQKMITEYVFTCMQKREQRIIIFLDNNQILLTKKVDEYIAIHGIQNNIPKVQFLYIKNKGYAITYPDTIFTITISEDILNETYKEFLEKYTED